MGIFDRSPRDRDVVEERQCDGCAGAGRVNVMEGGVTFDGKYEQRQVEVPCKKCRGTGVIVIVRKS